ncbi:MAG: O-methyltransferase [Candidatus Hydrogenedentes bacterium]|nr:O-methyltransferase [Candidatus Hydrogenedentota bacterium]
MEPEYIPPDIIAYCIAMTTPLPRTADSIFACTKAEQEDHHMLIGPIVGGLLRLLVTILRPKKVLEIGTYTGFSAAMMASAMPPGGKITTVEVDEHLYVNAQKNLSSFISHGLIEVVHAEGVEWLKNQEFKQFDLIFLDGRKQDYEGRYEHICSSVAQGGILVIDNSLAGGNVTRPRKEWECLTHEFNSYLRSGGDFLTVLLPVRDGLFLALNSK